MNFKKKLNTFLIAALIAASTSTAAFATPIDNIRAALIRGGVPADQVSRAVEYIQRYEITDEQEKAIIGKINSAAAKMNGQTDLTKVSADTRKAILKDIAEAMSYLGLKADYSTKSDKGATVVQVTDGEGNKVASGDANTSKDTIKNIDVTAIKEAVAEAKNLSQSTEAATFVPVSESPMKKTGTNYGNLMLLGLILMSAGSITVLFNKRSWKDKGEQQYGQYERS